MCAALNIDSIYIKSLVFTILPLADKGYLSSYLVIFFWHPFFCLMPVHDSNPLCHTVPDKSDWICFGRSLGTMKNGKKSSGVSPAVGLITTTGISEVTQVSFIVLPSILPSERKLYLGMRSFVTAQMRNDEEVW